MPELAVINRYQAAIQSPSNRHPIAIKSQSSRNQSLSNRHPSDMPELAVLDLRLLRGDGIDELPRKEPSVPE